MLESHRPCGHKKNTNEKIVYSSDFFQRRNHNTISQQLNIGLNSFLFNKRTTLLQKLPNNLVYYIIFYNLTSIIKFCVLLFFFILIAYTYFHVLFLKVSGICVTVSDIESSQTNFISPLPQIKNSK